MYDSRVDEVIKNVVYSAPERLRELQKGKIPTVYDGFLEYSNGYTIDEVVYKDPKSTIISTPSIFKDYYKNKYKRTFSMSLQEAIRLGYAAPLMLFIDGLFIKWSLITVVHDYNKDYFVINGVYNGEIKLILLNTAVTYKENVTDTAFMHTMFVFDEDGYYIADHKVTNGITATTITLKNIIWNRYNRLANNSLMLSGLGYKKNIYPENIITFSDDGKLIFPKVFTYPGSYYSIQGSGYINSIIFIRKEYQNDNTNIQLRFKPDDNYTLFNEIYIYNGSYINDYTRNFMEDIDFNLDPTLDWKSNREDIIKKILKYDPFLIADAYPSNVRCESYTGAEMKEIIGGETGMFYGTVKVLGYKNLSRALIFINGLCATNYVKHYLNKFEYQFMNLKDEDYIEIMYFENINNNAYTVTITKDNPYLPTDEISLDELAIFSPELENPEFPDMEHSDYTTFPVDFTIEDGKIVLPEYYYGKEITITSKNRYAYRFADIKEDTVSFELGSAFAMCPDMKRYIVFLNGKKLNSDEYFITCMKNTRPFSTVRFYSRYLLTPGDRVAVYYLPAVLDGVFNSEMVSETEIEAVFDKDTIPYDMPYEAFITDGNSVNFYTVDGNTAKVTMNNNGTITLKNWREETTIIIKETYRKAPGVSENGYFYVNRDKIPYPLSRDLFFVFNNGKKIPYHHLKNIGTDVMAITESMEIGNPYITAYHIPIPELEGLMTKYTSTLDNAIKSCTEEVLNKLFKVYTTITYAENVTEPNYDRAALINEVIRDNWMAPGVNYGVPVTYDYYSDMFGYEDSEGNIIFPTMDATQENSIIFTE